MAPATPIAPVRVSPLPVPLRRSAACCVGLSLAVAPWVVYTASGPFPAAAQWALALLCGGLLALCWPFSRHLLRAAALIAALLTGLIGLAQYLGLAAALAPLVSPSAAGQVLGNVRQPNQAATLMNMGLAVLLGWAQTAPAARVQRRLGWPGGWQGLSLAGAALLALGIAASGSRTGLLQMGMVFAVAAAWGRGLRPAGRGHLLVVMSAYLLGAALLPLAIGAMAWDRTALARMVEAGDACSSRLVLWANVLDLIAQRPWLGWGWGALDYAHYITLYPGERFCDILDNAHNLPLHLAVELGVPVALGVCAAMGIFVVRRVPWRERDPDRQWAWLVLLLVGVHSLVEYPLWYGPFQLLAWACVAVVWARPAAAAPVAPARATPGSGRGWRVLGSLMVLTGLYVGWDYHRISQIYMAYPERSAAYRDDTLAKVSASWLFGAQAGFAELTTTPLTPANAPHMAALAERLLHFSPESRVIEVLIESLVLQGRDAEALAHLQRYRAAFPKAHAAWTHANARAASEPPGRPKATEAPLGGSDPHKVGEPRAARQRGTHGGQSALR